MISRIIWGSYLEGQFQSLQRLINLRVFALGHTAAELLVSAAIPARLLTGQCGKVPKFTPSLSLSVSDRVRSLALGRLCIVIVNVCYRRKYNTEVLLIQCKWGMPAIMMSKCDASGEFDARMRRGTIMTIHGDGDTCNGDNKGRKRHSEDAEV